MSTNDTSKKITAIVAEEGDGEEYVVIPKARYEELLDSEKWELAVRGAGVDNWSGYDYAMEMYREDEDD